MHKSFVCAQIKCQISLWPIDRSLSIATTPGESRAGRNDNEGVYCIPQNLDITGTSPSDYLELLPGYTLEESYPSRDARDVMVIVVGNEHGDTSSNPGRDWLHFT